MSGHLIGCTGAIRGLGKSHKLALLAFADSADDRTHIAFPGYEGVQTWADCSRSRAAELIADLVTAGYLELHKTARPGRRAEYIVFPKGCCDLHRTPADDNSTIDVEALAAAAGVPVEAAAALLAAMTPTTPNGSEISDPSSGNRSENPDPLPNGSGNGSEISDPLTERVQNGSEISDPSTTTTTNPLTPASGGTSCAKHPAGDGRNCRGCGTTNRQLADRRRRDAAARARAAEQARAQAERERLARERRPSDEVADLLAQTRRQIPKHPAGATR